MCLLGCLDDARRVLIEQVTERGQSSGSDEPLWELQERQGARKKWPGRYFEAMDDIEREDWLADRWSLTAP